jgi:hypothetical protein
MKYIEGALDLKKYLYKLISNTANNIKNIEITAPSVSDIKRSESKDRSYDTYKANDEGDEGDEDNTIDAYEKILETQRHRQTHGDKTRVGSKSKKMQTAGKKRLYKQMKILEEDNRLHKEINKKK